MKKVLLILLTAVLFCVGIEAAKTQVKFKATLRNPPVGVDRGPFDAPIYVTYDSDTREIEVTGDDSEVREIQIFDDMGIWHTSTASLPFTYTVPSNRTGYMIVTVEGYDWDGYSKIDI